MFSKQEIQSLLQAFQEIAELVKVQYLDGEMMAEIFDLAMREKLTFYDASYLYACMHFRRNLITEDSVLMKSARINSVRAMDVEEWVRSLR